MPTRILVMGLPGAGKTTLAAALEAMVPMKFLRSVPWVTVLFFIKYEDLVSN